MTPTQFFACGLDRAGSASAASPTACCTRRVSLAVMPSNGSGSVYGTATPTHSPLASSTPTMRRYTALLAGGARLALPLSTRNSVGTSRSGTPIRAASSSLMRLITLADLAAPIRLPAPRTLSMVASSPLPLRTWCTMWTAQLVSLASLRNMAVTAWMELLLFSLTR